MVTFLLGQIYQLYEDEKFLVEQRGIAKPLKLSYIGTAIATLFISISVIIIVIANPPFESPITNSFAVLAGLFTMFLILGLTGYDFLRFRRYEQTGMADMWIFIRIPMELAQDREGDIFTLQLNDHFMELEFDRGTTIGYQVAYTDTGALWQRYKSQEIAPTSINTTQPVQLSIKDNAIQFPLKRYVSSRDSTPILPRELIIWVMDSTVLTRKARSNTHA